MKATDAIRNTIDSSAFIINTYLEDLSDADLSLRPVAGMNPIGWQLGHLISAERQFAETLKPGSSPPLPEGFEQEHGRDAVSSDRFRPKAEYVETWKAQRAATLAVLDGLTDDALDQPSGVSFAPTVGALLNMVGVHPLMHAGQFVAVRRALGKPVVI